MGDGVCVSTDKGGSHGAVGGLVEGSNVGYGEGYSVGVSGGGYGVDDDGCKDDLMDGVEVGDKAEGGGG